MKRVAVSDTAPGRDALKTAIRECRSARLRDRLRGVLWLSEGVSVGEVADRLNVGRNTPARWIHKVNEGGIDGLLDRKRSGRPSRLTPAQKEALRKALLGAASGGGEWTAEAVAEYVERQWGVRYGKSQARRLMQEQCGGK